MNLFISTATNMIHLATFSDGKIINYQSHMGNNNHSQVLYELLSNIDVTNVSKVYVVNGPGSFTGLRVSMIFTKSLALKYDIEIYPVNLMELLYYQNDNHPVYLDAKGKKYFKYDGDKLSLIKQDEVEGAINSDDIDVQMFVTNKFDKHFVQNNNLEIFYGKDAL